MATYHDPDRVKAAKEFLTEQLENGQIIYVTFQSKTRCHVYAELEAERGLGLQDITSQVAKVCDYNQSDVSIRIVRLRKQEIVHRLESALADALRFNQNFMGVLLD